MYTCLSCKNFIYVNVYMFPNMTCVWNNLYTRYLMYTWLSFPTHHPVTWWSNIGCPRRIQLAHRAFRQVHSSWNEPCYSNITFKTIPFRFLLIQKGLYNSLVNCFPSLPTIDPSLSVLFTYFIIISFPFIETLYFEPFDVYCNI